MKKLLILLLYINLIFSCNCSKEKEPNKRSFTRCSITENIWINETNQMRNLHRDYLPAVDTEIYFGLRFLKNGEIQVYKCGKSFINTTSDIINKQKESWGLNKLVISDTCCYLMQEFTFSLPDQIKKHSNQVPKWKKINDNTVIIIYPNQLSNDTLNFINCNKLESINGIQLIELPEMIDYSPYYNRSPKLNNLLYNF